MGCPLRARRRPSFLNFLRGMETSKEVRDQKRELCFLNFLRGMETGNCGGHPERIRELPKLP